MLRVIAALVAGLLLCAQTPMLPGFPPGTFQNRAAIDAAPAGGGGPTFDAASSSNMAASANAFLHWNHTNSGNAMCVALYTYNGGGVTVSSVTYNAGANFTKKTNSSTVGIGTNSEVYCSDGITLPTGTLQVSVNMSATGGYVDAWAISVTGGNAASPIGTSAGSASGTSSTPTSGTITGATGQLIFDIAGNDSSDVTITPNGAQTQRMAPQGTILQAAGSTKPGAASTTTSWTLGGSEAWAMSYGSFQ